MEKINNNLNKSEMYIVDCFNTFTWQQIYFLLPGNRRVFVALDDVAKNSMQKQLNRKRRRSFVIAIFYCKFILKSVRNTLLLSPFTISRL